MKTNSTKPENKSICTELKTLLKSMGEVLEKQIHLAEEEKQAIISGDIEKINIYMQLENSFIKKQEALAKTINTFNELYTTPGPEHPANPGIEDLKEKITRLKARLLYLNKENREAIKKQMKSFKEELTVLSMKKKKKQSPFKKIGNPSYIDTTA